MRGLGRPWDVIIVGARVAGSTLAMYLGKAGIRTLLIDRVRFPAYVPRQGSWELPVRQRWTELGVMPQLDALGAPIRRGWFSAVGDTILTYRFPEGDPTAYNTMVRRLILDNILAKHASTFPTVELRTGHPATALLWEGDQVVGVRTAEGGHTYEERARLVVGADGRHSWTARQVQAPVYERIVSPKANFIADYANTNLRPDMSVRCWDAVGSMGMLMMEDQLVTIGMGVPLTELPEFRDGLPDSFEQRLRRHPLYREQLGPAERVSPIGGAVDLAMFKKQPYGPGWALVGDAGYHLDPLAARGTSAAVLTAELLARAITSTFSGEQPESDAFARYQVDRDTMLASDWDITYAAIMRPPPADRDLREAQLLASHPYLLAQHLEVLRGLRDGATFRHTLDALLDTAAA